MDVVLRCDTKELFATGEEVIDVLVLFIIRSSSLEASSYDQPNLLIFRRYNSAIIRMQI